MSEKEGLKKPITSAFIGGHLSQVAYSRMLEKKFAAYPTAERAVDSMYALIERYRLMQRNTGSKSNA
jgi:acyl-CoA synthetase (NDP forming)